MVLAALDWDAVKGAQGLLHAREVRHQPSLSEVAMGIMAIVCGRSGSGGSIRSDSCPGVSLAE